MPPTRTRRARAAKKRQRRMAAVEHDLSPSEWTALQEAWDRCAYCGATGTPVQAALRQPVEAQVATAECPPAPPAAR